jgi:hypothetical protein
MYGQKLHGFCLFFCPKTKIQLIFKVALAFQLCACKTGKTSMVRSQAQKKMNKFQVSNSGSLASLPPTQSCSQLPA